jgi:hypothetical protein
VPSDWLDGEESDLHVPAVPPGFMREVVLCYSQPLAPRSRTVYYHYFEQVPNAPPGAPVVRRIALLTEDTVEGFLRSYQGLKEAGLQHTNFVFDDEAHGLPSIAPAQITVASPERASHHESNLAVQPEWAMRTEVRPTEMVQAGCSRGLGGGEHKRLVVQVT